MRLSHNSFQSAKQNCCANGSNSRVELQISIPYNTMCTVKNQETAQIPQTSGSDIPSNNTNNTIKHQTSKRQVGGAAVAGGIVGLALAGPVIGMAAAGGAALIASKNKGDAGKAARVTGDAMGDLGSSIKKFDKKHNIKEKTSKGIVKGCNWISSRLQRNDKQQIMNLQNT